MHIPYKDNKNHPLFEEKNKTVPLVYFNIINHTLTVQWFITAIVVSLVSQIGDLIISYFKRQAKLKDTGKILPGHGGFLDRFDGIIFVLPVTYLIVIPILITKLDLIK